MTDLNPEQSVPTAVPRAALSVAAVARRLGVAPATLRTWDRRYGLGPSEHEAGAHRRYSTTDVQRLLVMRRLTLDGVAPSDAARIALQTQIDADQEPLGLLSVRQPARRDPDPDPDDIWTPSVEDVLARPGDSGIDRAVRGLARAATGLDPDECRRILRRQVERSGTVETWQRVVAPVLGMVGERWQSTGEGVEVEHLLSECVVDAMREVAQNARTTRASRPVVLAAAEEEQHGLPMHVLAAALAERALPVRLFGVRVPRQALAAAVRRIGPSVVVVYAHLRVQDPTQVDELPRLRPTPLLLLAGPGWDGVATVGGAERVIDLPGAVTRIERAVGV